MTPNGNGEAAPAENTSNDSGGAPTTRQDMVNCKEFLKALGASIKLIGLYAPNHPVPTEAINEAGRALKRVFTDTQWTKASIGLVEGRWLVNDTVLAEASQIPEVLSTAFRALDLRTVTFERTVHLYELAAICELAATPAKDLAALDVPEFMKQKGVRRIHANVESYARTRPKEHAPPPRKIESPIPKEAQRPAPPTPGAGGGFGSFIKNLVEQSVSDPTQRAEIYADTVKMVKAAIDRRVETATRTLRQEKQQVVHERARTENVMANVAEGKVVVDREGKILMMDPAAEEILGKRLIDVAGKPILDSVDSGQQMASLAEDLSISGDKAPTGQVRTAGDAAMLEAYRQSMALVQDEQGRVVGTYGVLPYVAKFKEAMALQEEFLSHVTHELKAPLASICSALELTAGMASSKLNEQEKKFLDISRRNSNRLRQMIDEILDFSKLQSGRMSIHPLPTKIGPALREAVDGLRPWAATKKLRMEVRVEQTAENETALADYGRVVQIVTNLISNAIKSTPEGGMIWVAAEEGQGQDAGSLVISVKDNGCGISKADQERIFDKFIQAPAKGMRRDGVGLGLSIVKEMVSLHKGRLGLESEPDQGATFFFTLPLTQPET